MVFVYRKIYGKHIFFFWYKNVLKIHVDCCDHENKPVILFIRNIYIRIIYNLFNIVCAERNQNFIINWELRMQNGLYGGIAVLPRYILVR